MRQASVGAGSTAGATTLPPASVMSFSATSPRTDLVRPRASLETDGCVIPSSRASDAVVYPRASSTAASRG